MYALHDEDGTLNTKYQFITWFMTQIDMDVSGIGHNKSDSEVGGLDRYVLRLLDYVYVD